MISGTTLEDEEAVKASKLLPANQLTTHNVTKLVKLPDVSMPSRHKFKVNGDERLCKERPWVA